mgnify:CR=1 FL=1|jgi:hypothetical protein
MIDIIFNGSSYYNNIGNFIFGMLIKLYDDHYDMNIYNTNIIKVLPIFIIIGVFHWATIDIHYPLAILLFSFYSYLVGQIDNDYYKLAIVLFACLFALQLIFNKKKLFTKDILFPSLIITLSAFIGIFLEAIIFTEEFSIRKLISRILILIFCVVMYFVDLNKVYNVISGQGGIFDTLTEYTNNRLFRDTYSAIAGYCVISIINISYMCSKGTLVRIKH